MTLRIELFPDDLDAFVDFYTRALGFTLAEDRRESASPYAAVVQGTVRIGAVPAWEQTDRTVRAVPAGVEIVLEVEDVTAAHRRVLDAGYPVAQGLEKRPWGLTDFRVHDPAGYYLRVTGRS